MTLEVKPTYAGFAPPQTKCIVMEENSQFKKGNYNAWCKFITKVLPTTDTILREKVLPQFDAVRASMLGANRHVSREELKVEPIKGSELGLTAIRYTVSYFAQEMKVPDAPEKAVEADTQAILKVFLEIPEIVVNSFKIDNKSGLLELKYTIDLGK